MLSNFNTKAHPLALFWIHYQVPTKVHTNFRSAVHIFSFQLPGLSWFICQVRGLWGYWTVTTRGSSGCVGGIWRYWTVTTRGSSGCVGIWRWLYMFIDADQCSRVVHKQTRAVRYVHQEQIRKVGNVLFNDALNTFYFTVIWCWTSGKGPLR